MVAGKSLQPSKSKKIPPKHTLEGKSLRASLSSEAAPRCRGMAGRRRRGALLLILEQRARMRERVQGRGGGPQLLPPSSSPDAAAAAGM